MKYYEFDYKNKFQKALWNLSVIATGMLYTFFGFAITVWFSKFLSTFAGTLILFASCIVGLVITIYNSVKMKGVFLFDDCIEISSVYTKKTIIPISEITKVDEIKNYTLIAKYDMSFKGGDRTNYVSISFKNVGMATFKIKNQDEFLENLKEKMNNCD